MFYFYQSGKNLKLNLKSSKIMKARFKNLERMSVHERIIKEWGQKLRLT